MKVSLYVERSSFAHRLHPRVKLLGFATIFLAGFVMESAAPVLPLLAGILGVAIASGAAGTLRRFLLLLVMVPTVTLAIWSVFYGEGEPIPGVDWTGATWEGARYGLGMAARLETFIVTSLVFLSVTRVEELLAALRSFGAPYRAAFAVALAFRLVPLFLDSAMTVVEARRARGLEPPRGGLVARLRAYVPVLVPVFMGALRRADAMAVALEARGFSRPGERTTFLEPDLRIADGLAFGLLAAVAIVYLGAWWHGYGRIS